MLTADIVELATPSWRYGYRRIAALLLTAGWVVNVKRVERIWRRGVKVPRRPPKRAPLAERRILRAAAAEHPNQVWSYDFVEDRTWQHQRVVMSCAIVRGPQVILLVQQLRRVRPRYVLEPPRTSCG